MRDFHLAGRSPVLGNTAMVATSHPLAASEALHVLRRGGSAADAAITAAVLLGICEPHMCGIGGDMFALIKPAGSEEVVALNASGRSPADFDAEAVRAEGHKVIPRDHPAAVTVPGAVDGFSKLAERFGRIGLDACLEPAIRHAEEGVPVTSRVSRDWANAVDNLGDAARRHYLSDGAAPTFGQRFRSAAMADALRALAEKGRAGFYEGAVADDMLSALQKAGGSHSLEDFARTDASWGSPIHGSYRGTDLLEHPPNGQGATAILLSNILSQFDLAALDPHGVDRVHLEMEATKLAYDARNRILADPDHTARLAHMTALETAAALAKLIDPMRAMPDAAPIAEAVHKDTVLICAVDGDGMAVSLIYSLFSDFGSGIASDKYGILFHNRGSGFTLEAGHPNEAAPGKRPMHTIIPAMLRNDGRITSAFGVMGGQYQATGHAHVLTNLVDYAMDPQEALDSPRAFTEKGQLRLENRYSDNIAQALSDRGHTVVREEMPIGGGQIIQFDHRHGTLIAGSDPRKDGCALGW